MAQRHSVTEVVAALDGDVLQPSADQPSSLVETYTEIRYVEDARGFAVVMLWRPKAMNAFTYQMARELRHAIDVAERRAAVRAIILAAHPRCRAFCAGADLSIAGADTFDHQEVLGGGDGGGEQEAGPGLSAETAHRDSGGQVALRLVRCRKPLIAALHGSAAGIGITMCLPCDIRVVSADAKIGFVFVRRGICPEACSTWFLPRLIGPGRTREVLLTGKLMRAREMDGWGLFNKVLERSGDVLPYAVGVAAEIASKCSPVAVVLTKDLLLHGETTARTPEEQHLADSRAIARLGFGDDSKEGVMSFLQKREPDFRSSAWHDLPGWYPQAARPVAVASPLDGGLAPLGPDENPAPRL